MGWRQPARGAAPFTGSLSAAHGTRMGRTDRKRKSGRTMQDGMRGVFGCTFLLLLSLVVLSAGGCKKGDGSSASPSTAPGGNGATKATLTLDWNPEPEFGGF